MMNQPGGVGLDANDGEVERGVCLLLVVHAVGTGALLISAFPRRRAAEGWTPALALAQLLGAYVWFFVPVLAGPMVVLNAAGYLPASRFASAELEGNGS